MRAQTPSWKLQLSTQIATILDSELRLQQKNALNREWFARTIAANRVRLECGIECRSRPQAAFHSKRSSGLRTVLLSTGNGVLPEIRFRKGVERDADLGEMRSCIVLANGGESNLK